MTWRMPRHRIRAMLLGGATLAILAGAGFVATSPGYARGGEVLRHPAPVAMDHPPCPAGGGGCEEVRTGGFPLSPPGPFVGPPGDPLGRARDLAAAETAIGIRAGQLEVWRDFTDALQEMPPPPPRPDGAPLSLVSALATHGEETGRAAARLLKAVDALKAQLSPDQIEKLGRIELALLPPPPPPPPGGHTERPAPPPTRP